MFGSSAAGFGGAKGGFGTTTNQTSTIGGFGTNNNNNNNNNNLGGFGINNNNNTAGGFGINNNTNTAGGFGINNNTNTAGGFGINNNTNTAGGFGINNNTNTAGGFGINNNNNTAGGFGSTGGFGTTNNNNNAWGTNTGIQNNNNNNNNNNNTTTDLTQSLQEFGRQSTLVRYLIEFDNAYNALHPNCRFRTFLYNVCTPGQSTLAVQRERFIASQLTGGGCKEEEYIRAQEYNPDPIRLYPTPIHFMQELKIRAEKQQETISAMIKHVEVLMKKSEYFRALHEANSAAQRELLLEQVMLQRRWYSVLKKIETLRLFGLPLAEERRVAAAAKALTSQINTSGIYKSALLTLQPFLDAESATVASLLRNCPGDDEVNEKTNLNTKITNNNNNNIGVGIDSSCGILRQRTDPQLLKNWVQFTERIQEGLEAINALLEKDTRDMQTIRHRVGVA